MNFSEYICGTTVACLNEDEVILETTRRSQEVRTRQSLISLALVAVVGVGYLWSLWSSTNQLVLTVWVVSIVALTAWRSSISKRIRSTLADANPAQLVQNESDLVLTGITIPLIIGAGYWLFCTSDNSVITLAVTLLCCLYAIGSTVNTVAQRRMQALMVILNLGQGVLFFLTLGKLEDYAVAVQLTALILLLLGFAKRIHEMFVDLVRSDLENKQKNERLVQSRVEIEKALEDAVKANKTKSQFLAAASHDLSQPLHAMSMFIGNLKQSVEDDDSKREIVQKIETTSEILKQQFDGLLDMSRFDAGGVVVQKQPFDLYALCELLVQSEKISAEEKNVELNIIGERVNVCSDPVLLGRLVGNLIANAIKFTDDGVVELRLEESESGKVKLSVTDTGCGFSDTEKDRIFKDFVQLSNSARNRNKGAGLGLSIVRRISELLDVDITATSTVNVGSTFTLLIPQDESVVTSLHSERSANVARYLEQSACGFEVTEQLDLAGYNLLVVDDDLNILDALSAYISGRGGRAYAAADSAQAEEIFKTERIDFAIVDDMLGKGKSGFELASGLANDLAMKNIIIVTGNILPARMEILRSSGFGVYSKPLSGSCLDEIIGERLALSSAKITVIQ